MTKKMQIKIAAGLRMIQKVLKRGQQRKLLGEENVAELFARYRAEVTE